MKHAPRHLLRTVLATLGAGSLLFAISQPASAQSGYYAFTDQTLNPTYNTLVDLSVSAMALAHAGNTGFSTGNNSAGRYPGASGGHNFFSSTPKPAGSLDPYASFTLTPAPGKAVQLDRISFGVRTIAGDAFSPPAPGPRSYEIFTSADGFTAPVASGSFNLEIGTTDYWYLYQHTGLGVNGDTDTPLEVQVYFREAIEGVTRAGCFRIDDVNIGATAQPAAPAIIYTFTSTANTPTLAPASNTVAGIGASAMTLANADIVDFSTSQSSAGAYPGASGIHNYASDTPKPLGSPDPYASFILSPAIGRAVQLDSISFGARTIAGEAFSPPAPGPRSYEILTSADGFTTPVASGSLNLGQGTANYWYQYNHTGLTLEAGPDTPLEVRVYFREALEGESRGGCFRIDDVSIGATALGEAPTIITGVGLQGGILMISFTGSAAGYELLGNDDFSKPAESWTPLTSGVDLVDLGEVGWRYDVDLAAAGQTFFVIRDVEAP